jgi:hypothetical protein
MRMVQFSAKISSRSETAQAHEKSLNLSVVNVRYHTGESMKLNARILHLAHMVYL